MFLHGLNGSSKGTWGRFPELVLADEDLPVDVGLLDYPTFAKRALQKNSPPLSMMAEYILDQSRAHGYQSVLLVGHSMGGNLALEVVRQNDQRSMPNTENYVLILGILLLGTPQFGAEAYPTEKTKDGRYVSAFSDDLRQLRNFFKAKIDVEIQPSRTARQHVPVFAAVGLVDGAVRAMSAEGDVPGPQIAKLATNHREICKPRDERAESYVFLFNSVKRCLAPRTRPRSASGSTLLARVTGSRTSAIWNKSFYDACGIVGISDGIDVRVCSAEAISQISLCLPEPAEVLTKTFDAALTFESRTQDQSTGLTTLLVGTAGADAELALTYAKELIGPGKAGDDRTFVHFSEPTSELAEALRTTWRRRQLAAQPPEFLNNQTPNTTVSYFGNSGGLSSW